MTTVLSAVVVLLMILPVFVLVPSASSDPTVVDHGDMTKSIFWNFTNPADYLLDNSSINGGLGTLLWVNETEVENSTAQYLLGTRTNVDVQTIPDAMAIDNTSVAVQTLTLQPGPEGIDCYLDEWFPYWNPDGLDLDLSPEYDPDPVSSERSRIVMQFNLSTVPAGATVVNATLLLYEELSKGEPIFYTIHALNASFDEQFVSWRTRDATHMWGNVGGDFSTESFSNGTVGVTNGWYAFDLTRLVDLWTRGITPNYGFIIVPRDETFDGTKSFTSSDISNKVEQWPKLEVNYTLGQAVGTYESMPLGPGTNATFTLASWESGDISLATDDFATGNISPRWEWTKDPSLENGSVNFDRPGWLNVTGSQPTDLTNITLGYNYLHQAVSGNFRAETVLQEHFAADSMGAGLLMKSDDVTWLAIYKSGVQGNGSVTAKACNGGVNSTLGSIPWTASTAFLRIDRIDGTYQLLASTDGNAWNEVATYSPQYEFTYRVSAGLCVFSGGSPMAPVVEFDFVRIQPLGQSTTLDMRVRAGNSTDLADPSWQPWGAAIGPSSGAVLDFTGKYLQYQITMATDVEWISPVYMGFSAHGERYLPSGVITTEDLAALDILAWETMTAIHSDSGGSIEYSYSTDHGGSWTYLGPGTSYALASSQPSMMVMVTISTYDTLTSPAVDTLELVYTKLIDSFYVAAPTTVTAGETFAFNIAAKDSSNSTVTSWSGNLRLHAVNATTLENATAELYQTLTVIISGGSVDVPIERYDVAETIRILVTGGGTYGLSDPIAVLPADIDSVDIDPDVSEILEHTSMTFTATARDAFGNPVPDALFTWSADSSLGTLDAYSGASVQLTAGNAPSSGYIRASSGTASASKLVSVVLVGYAPVIDPGIEDQQKPEDFGSWSVDISDLVQDAEDPDSELRWYITGEHLVSVSGENQTGNLMVRFETIHNLYGTESVTLRVVDSDGKWNSTTFDIVITAVNDPPVIDHVEPLVVHYDSLYVFDFAYYVHDVDNPDDLLVLSVDIANRHYCDVSGMRIGFEYPESMAGTNQTVIVTVRDPGSLTSSTAVAVRITDDYPPEQKIVLPSMVLYQGATAADCVHLPSYFTDPDGDVLYYAHGYTHLTIQVKLNGSVDITAPNDWAGTEYVVISAIDPEGARAEGLMTVTVLPVNHPPVIAGVPDLMVRYDERYEFDLAPYLNDPDQPSSELDLAVDDLHCSIVGTVLSALYPESMNNTKNRVNISVSDGTYSDWWAVNITVSDNHPPMQIPGFILPDHSFPEDLETSYPTGDNLNSFFRDDEDGESLAYVAVSLSPDVTAQAVEDISGNWKVYFNATSNYYGTSEFTIRAIDSEGAIVEKILNLAVTPVPDAPVLVLPEAHLITEGEQAVLNLEDYITDPDSSLYSGDFEFSVNIHSAMGDPQDYLDCIDVAYGMIVFSYPKGFTEDHVDRFSIEVLVTDQDGISAADTLTIEIQEAPVSSADRLWLGVAILAIVAGGAGMATVAWVRRKAPFVIHDLMLIHNDGFLMGRHASKASGEIDEDVLSGMLSAVLNFVEDSMAPSGDSLRTFGFKEYQALVRRGSKVFVAVVYSGDVPDTIEDELGELLGTVERVYKKKLSSWTGDIDTDFAGLEVLIQSFVKDHSKGHPKYTSLWTAKPSPPKQPGGGR